MLNIALPFFFQPLHTFYYDLPTVSEVQGISSYTLPLLKKTFVGEPSL